MDAERFAAAKAGIENLITNEVSSLVPAVASEVREDGLPQDWVDDLPNLTTAQAEELYDVLDGVEYQWAVSLWGML